MEISVFRKLKIALITREFPYKEISYGGIGTYFKSLAIALHERGHYVEIFCASKISNGNFNFNNIRVNKVCVSEIPNEFRTKLLPIFSNRHNLIKFDIIESAEYGADAIEVKRLFHQVPLVIKLHTPSFLLEKYDHDKYRFPGCLKFIKYFIVTLIRFKKPFFYWMYNRKNDIEYTFVKMAEKVYAPSQSIINELSHEWNLSNVDVIKNIFIEDVYNTQSKYLNSRDIQKCNNTLNITYIGTLNLRKGIEVFTKVIPLVAQKYPNVKFKFIGRSFYIKKFNAFPEIYFRNNLTDYLNNFQFIENKTIDELYPFYINSDLLVFPAKWDNFPYVCLEALNFNKIVLASKNSGMSEMIINNVNGFLIDPNNPKKIAKKIVDTLDSKVIQNFIIENLDNYINIHNNKNVIISSVEKLYLNALNIQNL